MNTELERVNMSLISTETFRLDSENDLHTKMQALQVGEGHDLARVYLGLSGKIGVWLLCPANVIRQYHCGIVMIRRCKGVDLRYNNIIVFQDKSTIKHHFLKAWMLYIW